MGEGFVRRLPTRARSTRVATLLLLACVAIVTALLPAGAGAADGLGPQIYWGNEGGSIRFANLDGTGTAATLSAGEDHGPCGIALDPVAGKAYWANFDSGKIRVANLDGSGTASTLFVDPGDFVCGVAVDRAAGKIYWANFSADAIRVANLDGSGVPATLIKEPGESSPSGVAIDPSAGKIYWTNQDSDQVRVGNLDGSGAAITLFGQADAGDNPLGLAIDPAAGKVYWAAHFSDQIRVGNLDGSGTASPLFTDENGAGGIALDAAAGKLYWGTFGGGGIRVGPVDGSGTPLTLFQGENLPLFPALLRAPEPGGQLPAITGGANLGDALNCSPGSWKPDLLGAHLSRAPRSFAYQWQLDGTDISGATASSFTFTEAGDYTCRVTAANQAGSSSQTSAAFTVTLLDLISFYDANANGQLDPAESMMAGWRVQVGSTAYSTPKSLKVAPGVYQVTAASPRQTNWRRTTGAPVQAQAVAGDRTTVMFGNVCLGVGGAMGTGFWTNKNGQALVGADDLAVLRSLNLRNEDGTMFDPATYSAFSAWLGKTSGTNMAYDLSGQLAGMKLNVLNALVGGNSLISAAGTASANAAGFATVNAVMDEANTELGAHGLAKGGSPFRVYQTALRDALLNANGNKTFVQSAPCAFSF
jgi:DNA-binding beta-propeller fold protein YncE